MPTVGRAGSLRIYEWLARLVAAGVVLQVALAGLAVFGAARWVWHVRFSWFVEAVALLLVVIALVARVRGWSRWSPMAMLGLIMLQHASAALGGVAGAFHTVNALVVLGLAVDAARRAGALRADLHGALEPSG